MREIAVVLPDLFARELNPHFRIEERLPPLHDAKEHELVLPESAALDFE